jgi:hypothetical protein
MKNNGLDSLDGTPELVRILQAVESASSMPALAELAARLHAAGHTLLDALERA